MKVGHALPQRYLITPEPPAWPGSAQTAFLDRLARAIDQGVGLVQLRAKTLPAQALAPLAEAVQQRCRDGGVRLLLNDAVELAQAGLADGVHLSGQSLNVLTRRPLPATQIVCAACHDAVQLQQALALGVDCVTLSPVLPTATHPDAPALGWARFAALVSGFALPVYALGGLGPGALEAARAHGAHGIAAIRAFWPDTD